MPISSEMMSQLHPLEIQVLRTFQANPQPYTSRMLELTALQESQIRMALEWLQQKALVTVVSEQIDSLVTLTETGQTLNKLQLPELRILTVLESRGTLPISDLAGAIGETPKDANIAVANLKKAGLATIQKGGVVTPIAGADRADLDRQQSLLRKVGLHAPCSKDVFTAEDWAVVEGGSRKRGKSKGLFRITEKIDKQCALTDDGQALLTLVLERGLTGEEISQLTPAMLKDGSWKSGAFRAYNIEGAFPRIVAGKKNPYRQFLDFAKRKLIALGFEEMRGPLVESEFWNMDALYMPQFHAARAIHDAYYVTQPTHCKELLQPNASNVAATHTDGGATGSKGWRYQFDIERTKRLVLRSQGTALSARQLAKSPNIPGKYFAIARCFRYDSVDSTHAPDFFQVEGIVLGEEIDFRHLLGLLKLFALEVAHSSEVKFSPDYFPFTEPSVEVSMKHPTLGWVELGGAGIFRPEVTKPHGIDVPVIAWGLGLDRMAMVALGIQDIRDLFSADLDLIRSKRVKATI